MGRGNRALQTVDHTLSLLLFLHTPPCFIMESSTSYILVEWNSPFWVLSMGSNPSGMDCSILVFHRVTGPSKCQFQHGLLSQEVMTASAQPLCGLTASFRYIHLLCCGVFCRLHEDICSTMDLQGLQDILPHHGLHPGLQGNLCSCSWSSSCPSIFSDLGVHRLSLFSQLLLCSNFSHFLNMLSKRLIWICYPHCWWAQLRPAAGLFPLPLWSSW